MLCLLHRRSAPSFVAAEPAVREGTEVPPAQTRCGGREHANLTRPCPRNDTYCGEWKGRFWHPIGCEYEHISPSKAAACLRNRTIAFIGDSHIRDLCFGLVYYLLETYTLDTAPEFKFDRHLDVSDIGEVIGDFDFWKVNLPSNIHNGNDAKFNTLAFTPERTVPQRWSEKRKVKKNQELLFYKCKCYLSAA